ncbi:MAG: DUF1080 domain-containing protein [Kiritimatiellae bacterium]|nr:DUF1080 domain-containing protein [Kiritimatiellia bacterium]
MMRRVCLAVVLMLGGVSLADNGFDGDWCLVSPEGGAVWMRSEVHDGVPAVRMMWEINMAVPVSAAYFEGDCLMVVRPYERWYMTRGGMRVDKLGVDTLRMRVNGEGMSMDVARTLNDGTVLPVRSVTGRRSRPLPPQPDLTALKFGEPLALFDGHSLEGWRLTNPAEQNAWSVRDNLLVNMPELGDGSDAPQYGNLRTDREFEDFRLCLEVKLPRGGNSGIYLRGRYEVQVTDSYGHKPSWGGIGGVYGRIVPLENAARPAGEWQEFDIILADRHVTVKLNGKLVIDNQPLDGCTGGALSSDDEAPGPIYFQGDHTFVEYRNIRLYPRVK